MLGYIIRRIITSIMVVLLVAFFTFSLLYLTPGDPAYIIAGKESTPADIATIRTRLGLDRPFHERLWKWSRALAQGDLGESVFSGSKVTDLIEDRLEPSISLTILSTFFSIAIGVPLGVLAAWKANTWIDGAVMFIAVVGLAVPSFVLGLLLLWVLGVQWRFLPVAGYEHISDGFVPYIRHLILPAFTAAVGFVGLLARMTRSNMLEVLREDYIRTARAKGLKEQSVLFRHALQNAALPVLTIIGMGVALLIAGLIVVETVFAVPGLGLLVKDALSRRDYPIIQGMILLVAGAYVVMNLIVDILYAYLDPRIRYQ